MAWKNVIHNKKRTAAALMGVAFATLLVFMQLGFYYACADSSTRLFDFLDFDLILTSPSYVAIRYSNSIPISRVLQARGYPGVKNAIPVSVETVLWRNIENLSQCEVVALGVNPDEPVFTDQAVQGKLHKLKSLDTALMDQRVKPTAQEIVGPHAVGTVTEVNGRRIRIVDDFSYGVGFIGNSLLIMSEQTLRGAVPTSDPDRCEIGLVRLDGSVAPEEVIASLRAGFPDDVRVSPKVDFFRAERHFVLNVKPVGFMFWSGVLVGFLVGAVILYQILSADIARQQKQYATLKAMGYDKRFLQGKVIAQGLVFAILGYIPAFLMSLGLYAIIRRVADFPMRMTGDRMISVFVLSVLMCSISGLIAMRKVQAADPAELF